MYSTQVEKASKYVWITEKKNWNTSLDLPNISVALIEPVNASDVKLLKEKYCYCKIYYIIWANIAAKRKMPDLRARATRAYLFNMVRITSPHAKEQKVIKNEIKKMLLNKWL